MLAGLDVDLVVDQGTEAALVATLDAPAGRIVVR